MMITPLLSVILFVFAVATLLKRRNSESSDHDLDRIPGPKRLPLIGNLHLFLSKSPPHHIFRDLAVKYGPLMRLQMGEVPFLFVSSVKVAGQVLKTHDVVFANRPHIAAAGLFTYNCTNIGVSPYGEHWRQLRRIATLELLSARRVRYFRPIREEENADVAEWVAAHDGSPANLTERIYQSSFDVTSRAAIGKEPEEQRTLMSAVDEIMKLGSGFSLADLYPSNSLLLYITGLYFKMYRLFRQTDRIMESIIKQHRVVPATGAGAGERAEDLADVLLKCQQDDGQMHLTDDNIKAVIMEMFFAGGETAATAVDWAMSEMVRNPRTLRKAQDEVRKVFDKEGYVDEEKFSELKYLKLVIKEALRLHPPLPLLVPRQSSESCEINGYKIPAKTRLIVNGWALGRDPKYWNEAEKFKPERFEEENASIDFKGNNLEYVPFGAGRRMCPGMTFGLANVEFSLAMLLYHFDWKMPNGLKNEDLDMTESFGASVKRKHDLKLVPTLMRPLKLVNKGLYN